MMKSLQEMMKRQQGLIDRTFRKSQQNRPGQFRPGPSRGSRASADSQGQQGQGEGEGEGEGDDAGEQQSLADALGEMMRQLEEMMAKGAKAACPRASAARSARWASRANSCAAAHRAARCARRWTRSTSCATVRARRCAR